jgi:hypothetical protein
MLKKPWLEELAGHAAVCQLERANLPVHQPALMDTPSNNLLHLCRKTKYNKLKTFFKGTVL